MHKDALTGQGVPCPRIWPWVKGNRKPPSLEPFRGQSRFYREVVDLKWANCGVTVWVHYRRCGGFS